MSELVVNLSGVNFHALMLVEEGIPKIAHKNLIVLNVELAFPRAPRGVERFPVSNADWCGTICML